MMCQNIRDFSFLLFKADSSWLQPCCSSHPSFLQDFCLPSLLYSLKFPYRQLKSYSPQQVCSSVICITRITNIIREKNLFMSNSTQQLLLELVNQFLDYHLEVVGYKILDILVNLIGLHCNHCQKCALAATSCCEWLDQLKHNLMDISCLSRCRLNALCLLTTQAQGWMLNNHFFGQLYAQFGKNPAFDSGISALICQDICNTHKHHSFHIQAVKQQLLSDSLEVRSAIEKRLLLKKLQNAQFRHWFMDNFSELSDLPASSKHSLEAKLMLTKIAVINQKTLSLNLGWIDYMSAKSLQAGLLSNNIDVKLAAWNLLCDHPKTSRAVCKVEFKLAKQFVASNLVEQHPFARAQILAGLRKLFERMKENSRQLLKKKCMEKADRQVVTQYTRFLIYFLELAFDALSKCSNFNRRLSVLNILKLILCSSRSKSGELDAPLFEHFQLSPWLTPSHLQQLLNSLDDDYEICQLVALKVLTQTQLSQHPLDLTSFLEDTKQKLFSVKPSSKAQSSINFRLRFLTSNKFNDIMPVFSQLLSDISTNCMQLESNLPLSLLAITHSSPLYPLLSPIEGILTGIFECSPEWALQDKGLEMLLKTVQLCFRAAKIVSPVVHSLSPEGFLPQEFLQKMEQDNDIKSVAVAQNLLAQKLLLASWQTHKAVSFLFTLAMQKFPHPLLLNNTLIREIGDYFWLQLTKCRHKGAFGLAAEAFESFCKRLWSIDAVDSSEKHVLSPLYWLNQALDALSGKNDTQNLCSTRRSAGLPHLISSVVATQPKSCSASASLLHSTLDILLSCRQNRQTKMVEHPEREIHCVNVLKAMFSSNTHSDALASRMQEAFVVCLQGCSSSIWAIRNAHCQLFAVLVTKAFRSAQSVQRSLHVEQKCKMASTEFFVRYPQLYSLMHTSIANFDNSRGSHLNAFPVLILLTHLYPNLQPDTFSQPLLPFITSLLKIIFASSVQKLRDLGAAALLSITSVFELQKVMEWILKKGESNRWTSHNFLDATLTLIHFADELCLLKNASLMRLSQSIVLNLTKNRVLSDLPDMCRASLLSLLSKIGDGQAQKDALLSCIPLVSGSSCETPSYDCRCSIRPVASLLTKLPYFWPKFKSIASIRYALYRAVFLEQICIDKLTILDDLMKDFYDCKQEQDLKYIVLLLAREVEQVKSSLEVEKIQMLDIFIRQQLLNAPFLRSTFIKLQLHRILLQLNNCVCSEQCLQFLRACLENPNDEIRSKAIQIVEEVLTTTQNKELVKLAVLRLKDEETAIREHASTALTPYIWERGVLADLNSEISWSRALDRWPEVVEDTLKEECDNEVLFKDCQLNPFAESFAVFRFKEDFKDLFEPVLDD